MPEDDVLGRRRPLYTYLESLIAGRQVLEIVRATHPGTELLTSLGAAQVTVLDGDGGGAVRDRFDLVLVPDGGALARRPGAMATLRRLLSPGGRLVLAVVNADRGGAADGLGYYELRDALTPHFPRVQMFAATPFLGMGLVEFDGAVEGLRIDARLVKEGAEPPAAYVAIAGAEPVGGLGYALIQLPFAPLEARLAAGPAPALPPTAALLREEIDELRGRLRRASEDRAALDAEIAKLRRALTDADESVVALTRRTAEEMVAVTERITAGVRIPDLGSRDEVDRVRVQLAEMESRAVAAERRLEEVGAEARSRQQSLEDAIERLRLANDELGRARRAVTRYEERVQASLADAQTIAARDRAIAERDERIAVLEGEKQDLRWRLAEVEDRLRDAIARAVRTDGGRAPVPPRAPARPQPAPDEGDAARTRALAEFHRAASAHVAELTELKASVAEQSALVTELEDAVQAAEARAQSASAEASTLRKTAKDLEEADRARRSRLAELEGKLLRLEHERKAAAGGAADELDGQLRTLQAERDVLLRRADEERAGWLREREALRASIDELKHAAAARTGNGHDAAAANIGRQLDAIDEATGRLESTLGNYRERAGRLRDELEGIRRRLDTLSPSEIAGFLEELGEDLAELEK
jgi:predicted  nucleic acid-binding Zn-ribbon protein